VSLPSDSRASLYKEETKRRQGETENDANACGKKQNHESEEDEDYYVEFKKTINKCRKTLHNTPTK
jgi:hypothetical protein